MEALGNLYDIVSAFVPVDLAAAQTGDWVCVRYCSGIDVVYFKAVGPDNEDQGLTFQQAQTAAGGGAKNLVAITKYYRKQALVNLLSTGTWTEVTQVTAATVAGADPDSQSAAIKVFHIDAAALDRANGFDYLNFATDGAGGGAQLGCALYLLFGLRYPNSPTGLPNSIT